QLRHVQSSKATATPRFSHIVSAVRTAEASPAAWAERKDNSAWMGSLSRGCGVGNLVTWVKGRRRAALTGFRSTPQVRPCPVNIRLWAKPAGFTIDSTQ